MWRLIRVLELLRRRPLLHKVLSNFSWLAAEHLLRLSLGIAVAVFIARFLGPTQFGLLNYGTALVSLCGVFAGLGMQGILVRDLVRSTADEPAILGTGYLLQFIGGLVSVGAAAIAVLLLSENELVVTVTLILSLALPFKSLAIAKYWFESRLQSKDTVRLEGILVALFAGSKITLVLVQAPLIWFAWAITIETALTSFALLGLYSWRTGRLRQWRFESPRARQLLSNSWPLILSSMLVMIYMRVDQVMLGHLAGNEAVGIYAAAIRVSESLYFLPAVLVTSAFPAIMGAKDSRAYDLQMQRLYDAAVGCAIICGLSLTVLADFIVDTLYGASYRESARVLTIHGWTGIFAAMSLASGRWMIDRGLYRLALQRNALGLVMNVALNALLIPRWGASGAAFGTLCSLAVSAYLFDLISADTRAMFLQKTRAMLCLNLMHLFLSWKK